MAEAERPSRIDVHHHFFAPEYLAVMGDMAKRPVVREWTLARSLEEMDKNGIGTAVLSLSPPGLHHVSKEETRRLARAVNEHAAKMRSTHPARYGHFASVPMPDVDGTLAEIAYALRHAQGRRRSIHDKLRRALSRPSRFRARHGRVEPAQRIGLCPSAGAGLLCTVARLDFARAVRIHAGHEPLRLQPIVHRNARALRRHTLHLLPFGGCRSSPRRARCSDGTRSRVRRVHAERY